MQHRGISWQRPALLHPGRFATQPSATCLQPTKNGQSRTQDRPPAEESWRDPDRPRGIPGLRPGEPSVANPDDTHELLDWSLAYSALPPNEGTLPHSQPVEVDADVLA